MTNFKHFISHIAYYNINPGSGGLVESTAVRGVESTLTPVNLLRECSLVPGRRVFSGSLTDQNSVHPP